MLAQSDKPENGDSLNRLAYQYAEAGLATTGISILQRASELFPQDGNLRDSMGELYLALGDKAKAIAAYRRALELDPGNTNAAAILKKL